LTGRQQVHTGWFCLIRVGEQDFLGTHPHGLRAALRSAADAVRTSGFELPVSGLSHEWSESPMSANTGLGLSLRQKRSRAHV
jgi:hypothetical protein